MSDCVNLKKVEDQIKEIYNHNKQNIDLMFDERASVDVFNNISYNGVKLKGVCSIHVEQRNLVVLQPYNPDSIKAIEDVLKKSNLGYLVSIKGNRIYGEKEKLFDNVKQSIIKSAKETQENALISVRKIRQDVLQEIKKNKKTLSENISKKMEKDLQKIIDEYTKKIKDIPTNF